MSDGSISSSCCFGHASIKSDHEVLSPKGYIALYCRIEHSSLSLRGAVV